MGTTGNAAHREPWNKGKIVGQKAPFKLKDIWALRVRLQMEGRVRDTTGCCLVPGFAYAPGQLRTVKHLPGSGRSIVSLTCFAPSMKGGRWPIRALTACQ